MKRSITKKKSTVTGNVVYLPLRSSRALNHIRAQEKEKHEARRRINEKLITSWLTGFAIGCMVGALIVFLMVKFVVICAG